MPAALLFTVLTFMVALLHLENFHFDAEAWHTVAGTWAWLVVYPTVPLNMGWLLIRRSRLAGDDPDRASKLPTTVRFILALHALILLPPGLALLLSPLSVATAWPWGLTALTGRAIGAWLLSIGVIAAIALFENDWSRLRAFAASYGLLATRQLLALLRYGSEVDWSAPAGFTWDSS